MKFICCIDPFQLQLNSQSGGGQNKIVLHLKGLFLTGKRTTTVLSSKLGITEMGSFEFYKILSMTLLLIIN